MAGAQSSLNEKEAWWEETEIYIYQRSIKGYTGISWFLLGITVLNIGTKSEAQIYSLALENKRAPKSKVDTALQDLAIRILFCNKFL